MSKTVIAAAISRPAERAAAALARARRAMDKVFALVPRSRWLDRPVPERHRLLFYLGHVEAFDWNLLRTALSLPSAHSTFDQLFAFGIDPKNGQLPDDAPSDWPSVRDIIEYSRDIRRHVDRVLADAPRDLAHIAVEHRLMHAETFTYLLHNLPEPVGPKPAAARARTAVPDAAPIAIPAGIATLGRNDHGFGWDNEFDAHTVFVPAFQIDRYKVTNGQYLKFVKAGAPPPHFWRCRHGAWYWRALGGEIPLPLDWPVYVTHSEAEAYAAWTGRTLPSEAEFHRAAYGTPTGEERRYPWGDAAPTPARGNFGARRADPVSVAATPGGDSAFGVAQLVGNGWEWTSTPFAPFAGFQAHAAYPGYSAPFFDGEHYVLKGASPVTPARLIRCSFRNWFRPSYRYVYATFRCISR